MVIMALDHSRDFWSRTPVQPEDVAHASVLLFLTRWVTHLCAPTFVFLSGCSVYLYTQKRQNRVAVSRFLLTRGLWLIVVEVVVLVDVVADVSGCVAVAVSAGAVVVVASVVVWPVVVASCAMSIAGAAARARARAPYEARVRIE